MHEIGTLLNFTQRLTDEVKKKTISGVSTGLALSLTWFDSFEFIRPLHTGEL